MKLHISHFILIIVMIFTITRPASAENLFEKKGLTNDFQDRMNFLIEPSGRYAVGYKDYHWINPDYSDPFYKIGENEDDFSDNNSYFNREIMVRIYYPTYKRHDDYGHYSFYYPPFIHFYQQDIRGKIPEISEASIQAMRRIKTYTLANTAPDYNSTFPVIFFLPGLNTVAQNYSNIISDLVSHGYIVVAINNTFVGRAIEFPDGHIVDSVVSDCSVTGDMLDDAVHHDLEYVYNEVMELQGADPLFSIMDIQHIGLLGHSMGAVMTVIFAQEHPDWFNSAAALAAPAFETNYDADAFKGFNIPFMHMHDSEWRATYDSEPPGTFELRENGYFVLMTPENQNDLTTNHNNFTDFSTLQYQAAIKMITDHLYLGKLNGFEAAQMINEYLLQFFNETLKDKPSRVFEKCIPLENSTIQCGPGKVPPTDGTLNLNGLISESNDD